MNGCASTGLPGKKSWIFGGRIQGFAEWMTREKVVEAVWPEEPTVIVGV
jgi:hypothetical protein